MALKANAPSEKREDAQKTTREDIAVLDSSGKTDTSQRPARVSGTHDPEMTREQSENIDLAEKGMISPVNPTRKGFRADEKDKQTVLEKVEQLKKP